MSAPPPSAIPPLAVPAVIYDRLNAAQHAGQLTPGAVDHIRLWLTDERYAAYRAQVIEHVDRGRWAELDDAFWTVIPFGTGGRRGKMYPIGSNAINDVTIGESAQGLAEYVREQASAGGTKSGKALSCAIAYDTRHGSRHFAELCSEVMVASGFRVCFLDGCRSTPELSFAVRLKGCACGIMVTASHNPPSDNAVKAYWSTGGQLLPPHDRGVIDRVMNAGPIRRVPFAQALAAGQIELCQQEVDAAYIANVRAVDLPGPRQLKIVYSPMHGVGATSVCPVLAAAGFNDVEVYAPHAAPDGDFPNVPDHVANPENPRTFDGPIARAKEIGADLVLSTDPDADRLGCAAPVTPGGPWQTFTGNQIAVLLTDYLLSGRKGTGQLSPAHYVVKTLVTTEMVRRIADSYGVQTIGDLQVGFKWIAGAMDEHGPDKFIFGVEESHGYLAGQYARDKDAAVAALFAAGLAAQMKAAGRTLHEKLDDLYWQYGCHLEKTVSRTLPGSAGMETMRRLMQSFREQPPGELGGLRVVKTRDYQHLTARDAHGVKSPLVGPKGDMVIFDLAAEGNYVAVRPSGTEPKVKFYLFAYEPPEQLANLADAKADLAARLARLEQELFAIADRA